MKEAEPGGDGRRSLSPRRAVGHFARSSPTSSLVRPVDEIVGCQYTGDGTTAPPEGTTTVASIAPQKVLMTVSAGIMRDLVAGAETGMDFYIVDMSLRFAVVLENADALPLYTDPTFYSLDDLLQGTPIPSNRQVNATFAFQTAFANRLQANTALLAAPAPVSTRWVSGNGAIPLVNRYTLGTDTMFLRYISLPADPRYDPRTGELRAGTYLTSRLDSNHADTGFGSIGRFALPIPLPITSVIEYTLPAGTVIDAGTVAPNYGQAGGGVEICLTANTVVTVGATTALPAY